MMRMAGAMPSADRDAATAEPLDLVAAAANGDVGAFESLYRRYAPQVYGLCLRLTGQREAAEDCTQESFVAAWRALHGFESRARFATWLHRIAVRAVADANAAAPPLDLERAIAKLPAGARDVLVLVGIYGYSHAEAAEVLDIAEGTCKAQLHRARGLLSTALGLEES
jgi:RNA polymerase sigma-70 factor, ECF subfamily